MYIEFIRYIIDILSKVIGTTEITISRIAQFMGAAVYFLILSYTTTMCMVTQSSFYGKRYLL